MTKAAPAADPGQRGSRESFALTVILTLLASLLPAALAWASPGLNILAKSLCVAILGATILWMNVAEIRRQRGLALGVWWQHFLPEATVFKRVNGLASLALAVLSLFPQPLWGFVVANFFYYLVSLDGLRGVFRHPWGQALACGVPGAIALLALGQGDYAQAASLAGAVALILSFSRLLAGQWSGIGVPYRFAYFLACVLLAIGAGLSGPDFLPLFVFEVFLALLFLAVLILRRDDG
ncbi:MAG: hypothetical protein AAGD01_12405 [Acidobacteriota bacterium]